MHYSLTTYLVQIINVLTSIYVAKLLGPENFGIYNALLIFLGYAAYLEFGALSLMGRDLPFFIGQNTATKVLEIDGAARHVTILGSLFGFFILFSYSFVLNSSQKFHIGLQTISIVIILQQIYTYHRIRLRSFGNFKELSIQNLIYTLITSFFAISFVFLYGFNGRLFALFLSHTLIIIYALFKHPWPKVPILKFNLYTKQIISGLPILISSLLISIIVSVDRIVALNFLGALQLGYISIGYMLFSFITLIPSALNQVLFTHMNIVFGKENKQIDKLELFVLKPTIILSKLLPLIIGPLVLILPFLITYFLPDYIKGIQASRIIILATFFYGIIGSTDNFLVTTNKLSVYFLFGGIALIINILLDILFINLDFGILGIAFGGTFLTYFIYSTLLISYSLFRFKLKYKVILIYFLKIYIPFFYMVFLLFSIEYIADKIFLINSNFFSILLKVVIYIFTFTPLVFKYLKTNIFNQFKNL